MNLLPGKKYGVPSQNFEEKNVLCEKGDKITLFDGIHHTADEGPVRFQYKCLVPIYVYPEMKLHDLPKQNYNVMSPNFCERFIYSQAQWSAYCAAAK
jgi:hypothetical protein